MDSCPVCAASGADAPAPSCPLAAEWEDEERMEFLTSHVAPGDLNARLDLISFWSKAVAHACEQAPGLSVDPAALASTSLDWGGATAPGLGLAIQHMLSAGTLVPRSNIEGEEPGLARRLVFAPLLYLVEAAGLGALTGRATTTQYVNRDVMEALAERELGYCQHLPPEERTFYLLAAGHSKPVSQPTGDASPWCFEQLCRAAAAAGSGATASGGLAPPKSDVASRMLSRLSRDDIALLARYLVRTKRAVEEDGVLKILGRGVNCGVGGQGVGRAATAAAAAAGESSAATISETEKDLLRLRCTVCSLEASASDLGRRIQQAKQDALRERRQGQKRAALVHLGRMKQFQAARDKRLSSLYTLETALDQVKQLRMDKQVLEAHEAATSALKACREAQGLTVERVEDTLDALAEEMAEQHAIGAALAQDGALAGQHGLDGGETEAAELEAELEALLRTEAEDKDDSTNAASPAVPATAAAPPTTAASAEGGASSAGATGRGAAPAKPAASTSNTPSPSLTAAVPEKQAVPAPAPA